ncbi:MAG: hypothetical protein AAF555_10905 [Verrucomicrobiota bacterium]
MPRTKSLSVTEAKIQKLETELEALRGERAQILADQLAAAEAQLDGLRSLVKEAGGATPAPRKPGRRPGKKAAKKKAAKKKGKRTRVNAAEAAKRIEALVTEAGAEGISGREVALKAGIAYQSALKILNGSKGYKRTGKARTVKFFKK